MGTTEILAGHIVRTTYDALPADVVRAAKDVILDGVGVMLPANFADMWVEVTARTRDGRVATERCDRPRGIWGNPLTSEERVAKFRSTAGVLLSRPKVEQALGMIESLETLPALRDLVGVIRGGRAAGRRRP